MKWYENQQNIYQSVIISSRIRLARNVRNYPFPNRMSDQDSYQLLEQFREMLHGREVYNKVFSMIDMNQISSLEKIALMEQHLISPAFINATAPNALILSDDESLSIMINEEDHLRIQAMGYGADLNNLLDRANELDDFIEQQADYSFDRQFGYLTACPTNVGTGLRASYMMHVPALEKTGQLRIILEAIGKFGITFRGIYGESSESIGSVFQVSNQVTLGFSEQEILENLNSVTMQIVDQELAIREKLLTEKRVEFEDSIYRSYGTLSHARILTSKEAMSLLSDIKLGIEIGILKTKTEKGINIFNLMTMIQPANIQKYENKVLDVKERDIVRATMIRQSIPDIIGG